MSYKEGKARAISEAQAWQADFDLFNYSYSELIYFQLYFEKLGKRYGLLKEFKSEGII